MKIRASSRFKKMYKKVDRNIQHAFIRRVELFKQDPYHALLRNHALTGNWKGYRSINITGDWRAVFTYDKKGKTIMVTFEAIGTHSQLYK
jgi:addiction module RelE/StbE family toxin